MFYQKFQQFRVQTIKSRAAGKLLIYFFSTTVAFSGIFLIRKYFLAEASPVAFRIFYWGNRIDFFAGITAILLFSLTLFPARFDQSGKSGVDFFPTFFVRFVAGILLYFSIAGMQIHRPAPVAWFKPGISESLKAGEERFSPVELEDYLIKKIAIEKKPVVYFFSADWCLHCPDFEKFVIRSPRLTDLLKEFICVKMDLTQFDKYEAFIEERFGIHSIPSLAFRNRQGRLLNDLSIKGDSISVESLGELLKKIKEDKSVAGLSFANE